MRFIRIALLVLILFSLAPHALFSAETETKSATGQDGNANISKRLMTIDQRLKTIAANQKQISDKNEEIQNQLKSLRVWLFHRSGGRAP